MEHDKRTCPRCGELAGDYGFCQSCRSHLDSLSGIPTRAGAHASEASLNPAEVLSQVMRLEQALAAVSKGINDRIAGAVSTAAVQVEPAPRPAENTAAPRDGVLLPGSADERVSEAPQAPREVARLEDVLKVDPAQNRAAAPAPETNPAVAPELDVTDEVIDAVAEVAVPTSLPSSVSAQALREAFWFEQASAFKPAHEVMAAPPQAQGDAAEVLPTPVSASPVEPEPCEPASEAATESTGWGTAIFLLALVALVMLLTGRKPRR
jgi:hypothetical protein